MGLETYLIAGGIVAATIGVIEGQTRENLYFRLMDRYNDGEIKEKPTFWNARRLFKKYFMSGETL